MILAYAIVLSLLLFWNTFFDILETVEITFVIGNRCHFLCSFVAAIGYRVLQAFDALLDALCSCFVGIEISFSYDSRSVKC
uniref:Uncharacterized protein n=1 Tax=Solanum lycopersicum TaxID=4081 RepID=K4AVV3_SOLLC